MKYMLMFKSTNVPPPGTTPCKKELPEMAQAMRELAAAGKLLWTEGLMPPSMAVRIKLDGKKAVLRDGPFAEAKEMVAGFAVVNVPTQDEAVAIAKRFLEIAQEGEAEVVPVFGHDS